MSSKTTHAVVSFDPPKFLKVTTEDYIEDVEILRSKAKPTDELFKCNACQAFRFVKGWPKSYVVHRKTNTCKRTEKGIEARMVYLQNKVEVEQALLTCGWGPKPTVK